MKKKEATPDAILAAAAGLLQMTVEELKAALARTEEPKEPEKLLTRKDAAAMLRVSTKTIQTWDRIGKLTPVKLGYRSLRYRQSDLQRLLDGSGKAA